MIFLWSLQSNFYLQSFWVRGKGMRLPRETLSWLEERSSQVFTKKRGRMALFPKSFFFFPLTVKEKRSRNKNCLACSLFILWIHRKSHGNEHPRVSKPHDNFFLPLFNLLLEAILFTSLFVFCPTRMISVVVMGYILHLGYASALCIAKHSKNELILILLYLYPLPFLIWK